MAEFRDTAPLTPDAHLLCYFINIMSTQTYVILPYSNNNNDINNNNDNNNNDDDRKNNYDNNNSQCVTLMSRGEGRWLHQLI